MKHWLLTVAACGILGLAALPAQEPKKEDPAKKEDKAKEDPVHNELRALKKGLAEAIEKGMSEPPDKRNLDAAMPYLHPNIIVTWQDGKVSKGHEGVKEYYKKMMVGDKRIVDSVKSNAKDDDAVDALSVLYNDGKTAVAYGKLKDEFKLRDGTEFELQSRWSAVLVKEGDRWQIVDYHASANMFDNPILSVAMRKVALWTGGIALLVGLMLGLIIARFTRGRPQPAAV